MKSASNACYISKRTIDQFNVERKKKQSQPENLSEENKENKTNAVPVANAPFQNQQSPVPIQRVPNTLNQQQIAQPQQLAQPLPQVQEFQNSDEEFDSDDLDGNLSDDGSHPIAKDPKAKKSKYKTGVDTNIFQITFVLKEDEPTLKNEAAVFCTNCDAIYNSYSDSEWHCEFCNTKVEVKASKPQLPEVCYVTAPADTVIDKQESKLVMVCLDASGSMNSSVQGHNNGSYYQRFQAKHSSSKIYEGSMYMTLLSSVDRQLDQICSVNPQTVAGVCVFDDKLTFIGDGTTEVKTISDRILMDDFKYLKEFGKNEYIVSRPISETKEILQDKLISINNLGPATALGPAALTSVSSATNHKPGSSIIICTDGGSNCGLGSMNHIQDAERFYDQVGKMASDHGITVSLISIQGAECNIQALSKMCEQSGGVIERCPAAKINETLDEVLSLNVVASNVIIKIKLHKYLKFRNEQPQDLSDDCSTLKREIGNATKEAGFTFEYELKPIEQLLQICGDDDLEKLDKIPFQVQISYRKPDGSRYLRVITQVLKVSHQRAELEVQADSEIVCSNAVQQASRFARNNQIEQAQCVAKAWSKKFKGNGQTEQYTRMKADFGEIYGQLGSLRQEARQPQQMQQQMPQQRVQQTKGKKMAQPMPFPAMGVPQQQAQSLGQQPQQRIQQSDFLSQNLYAKSSMNQQYRSKKA